MKESHTVRIQQGAQVPGIHGPKDAAEHNMAETQRGARRRTNRGRGTKRKSRKSTHFSETWLLNKEAAKFGIENTSPSVQPVASAARLSEHDDHYSH